jgi:hypothetical protein
MSMPSKKWRPLITSDTSQVAKTLDRKVKAVDRLHTSLELLLAVLAGCPPSRQGFVTSPTAKMVEQRLSRYKRLLESQDRRSS